MLMDLKAPLKKGDKIPVTLKFEKAGNVNITLDVRDIGATGATSGQMNHAKPGMDHRM
jgi:copper(I)-binding protein